MEASVRKTALTRSPQILREITEGYMTRQSHEQQPAALPLSERGLRISKLIKGIPYHTGK